MPENADWFEGWIPSGETLRDLLAIAPPTWRDRLASLSVREGLFAKTPTWTGVDADPALVARALEIAQRRSLMTDAAALDLPQLWQQLVTVDALRSKSGAGVTVDVADPEAFLAHSADAHINLPWPEASAAVSAEQLQLALEALYSTFAEHPNFRDLTPFQGNTAEEWARSVLEVWARSVHHTAEPVPHSDEASDWVWEAAQAILKGQGYWRGPCPRCGRKAWLIRQPKLKGRPPLTFTYCPPCAETIKREQKAESMRKARANARHEGSTEK